MDRRLVEKLKEYDNAETVVISNAGANVFGLKNTIAQLLSENNFAEIRIITHDNCLAMKLVTEHIFEMKRTPPNIYVHLVRQFENKVHQAAELDSVNEKLQKERMEGIAKGTKVYSEMLKMHTLGIPPIMMEQRKIGYQLIVSKPVFGGYRSLFDRAGMERYSTYAILGYGEELLNDIEIVVSWLGVIEIFFLIQHENERRNMEKYRDLVKISIHRSEIVLGYGIKTSIVENFPSKMKGH
jgi:carbonic anhydrase